MPPSLQTRFASLIHFCLSTSFSNDKAGRTEGQYQTTYLHIERGQGHCLEQDRFYLRVSVSFECGNIGIGKFKSRDFITLTSKVEAVFTCTCANVEYLVAIFQIFFYVVNGSLKFNSCGFGMIEPCILVEYIVGSVCTFTLIFYFCKLFKVHFIYTSRFSHIN